MANITASKDVKRSPGDLVTVPIAASLTVYAGALLAVDANGFAVNAADTAGYKMGGIAADTVSNASGANGDKKVAVYTEGTFELAFSGTATQATVGQLVYMVDNQTVALAATTTNDVLVGKIVEFINSTTVRVKI